VLLRKIYQFLNHFVIFERFRLASLVQGVEAAFGRSLHGIEGLHSLHDRHSGFFHSKVN
jgi:hypothetical protein